MHRCLRGYPLATSLNNEQDVIEEVGIIIHNGYRLSEKSTGEVNQFYPYKDFENRKRIFAVVQEESTHEG